MRAGLLCWVLGAVAVACAPAVRSAAPAPAPSARRSVAIRGPARCPARVEATLVQDLFARHARAYGSPEAVAASLPITLAGTATVEGREGRVETTIISEAHRSLLSVAGILAATGVDANGAWAFDGGSGVVERLPPAEGVDAALGGWLLRRAYVGALDANIGGETVEGSRPWSDKLRCEDLATGGARVDVTFPRRDLGSPTLAFDLESAALLSVVHEQADGKSATTTFEAWGEADRGVRWPRKSTDHPAVGSARTSEITAVTRGLECSRIDPSGLALPERGPACAAPPPDRFVLRWPAADALGRTLVRLPFTYLGGEILVRARLGGRDVSAFLDSGAVSTAVAARTPAGLDFRPSMDDARASIGELPVIDLGDLHAENVPAVRVPIPALDAFGDKRPELILGYAFFASAVIRVDYRRLEVVIAKGADGLFAKGNEPHAVPLRVLERKILVDGAVEGVPAPFEVDTGNGGGLELYKRWASAHDLPGARPVATMTGRFGAGGAPTSEVFFRLGKASLGPINFDGHLSHFASRLGSGIVAGLAGNEVLARCDAVVFDVPKRTLWLEGPCDRPVPERRIGWRLEKKIDPAQPDRPWVVSALWPDGPAERAGIRIGDRVLSMGGTPATADVAPLWALEQQPAGTKLPVVVSRGGAANKNDRERVVVELRSLTP